MKTNLITEFVGIFFTVVGVDLVLFIWRGRRAQTLHDIAYELFTKELVRLAFFSFSRFVNDVDFPGNFLSFNTEEEQRGDHEQPDMLNLTTEQEKTRYEKARKYIFKHLQDRNIDNDIQFADRFGVLLYFYAERDFETRIDFLHENFSEKLSPEAYAAFVRIRLYVKRFVWNGNLIKSDFPTDRIDPATGTLASPVTDEVLRRICTSRVNEDRDGFHSSFTDFKDSIVGIFDLIDQDNLLWI